MLTLIVDENAFFVIIERLEVFIVKGIDHVYFGKCFFLLNWLKQPDYPEQTIYCKLMFFFFFAVAGRLKICCYDDRGFIRKEDVTSDKKRLHHFQTALERHDKFEIKKKIPLFFLTGISISIKRFIFFFFDICEKENKDVWFYCTMWRTMAGIAGNFGVMKMPLKEGIWMHGPYYLCFL